MDNPKPICSRNFFEVGGIKTDVNTYKEIIYTKVKIKSSISPITSTSFTVLQTDFQESVCNTVKPVEVLKVQCYWRYRTFDFVCLYIYINQN